VAQPAVETSGAGAARQWLLELCHRSRLSPTQRRVGQFYIDSMPDGAFLSTMEAAARAGVSQPTVTRFAAALGFATYADFQVALRSVLLERRAEAVQAPGQADAVEEAVGTLEQLRETLDSAAMTAAAEAIAGADALAVVGMRASAALAAYTGYFAARILDEVRVVDDGDTALDVLSQLERRGSVAVLVFAMPRYPASTVRALRYARRHGMTSVLVVDTPLVDFAADADHVLVAPVASDLVFDSHPAPVLLGIALLDRVGGLHPRRTQERLETHEALVTTWVHGSYPD
jgi:DNA-binding MurR/RpiR family transcriptional regulator